MSPSLLILVAHLGVSVPAEAAWHDRAAQATVKGVARVPEQEAPIMLACRFRRWQVGPARWSVSPALPPCPVAVPPPPKGVLLQTRLITGQPVFLETTTEITQTMNVMQMKVAQKQRQSYLWRLIPEKKEAGLLPVRLRILAHKMDIDIGGNRIEYDSWHPGAPRHPLSDFLEALKGVELICYFDQESNLRKTDRTDLQRRLGNVPQLDVLASSLLSDTALQQIADPYLGLVPNRLVRPGETWKRQSKLDMGPIGTWRLRFELTYEGEDKGRDRITVKTQMEYEPPSVKEGMPFDIRATEWKSPQGKGVVFFDRAKGRAIEGEFTYHIAGTMNIDIGGLPTVISLEQDQRSTFRVLEHDPTQKRP